MPGTFQLNIRLDNAAFDDENKWREEVRRLLCQTARGLKYAGNEDTCYLIDIDGNQVGTAINEWQSIKDKKANGT